MPPDGCGRTEHRARENSMSNTPHTTVFAGIDARTPASLPEWYRRHHHDPETITFSEAIRCLPRASTTEVAYRNPYLDDWVATDRFTAIVEPGRLAEQQSDEAEEPLFAIPTDAYSVINPVDVYGPLEKVLHETEYDDRVLGEVTFGEIRQSRGGGEVHMDILFDGYSVELPGRREPITLGVTTGYDYFGGHAVYVEGFARDTVCANSIRQLTDRETVRHVGAIGDFREWWERILTQLDLVANDLIAFIAEASDSSVDFTEVPFDLAEFYALLGFPEYLVDHAVRDVRAMASNPLDVDMWTLHSGATYALTHFFTGGDGVALDRYVTTANDILFNPSATLDVVERSFERRAAEARETNGQTDLESQVALAQLERVGEDIHSNARRFEEREAELRSRFASVADD
ncbi:hypothetical protein [Halobaculum halobium]|uniref:hypothetical protein n=1 Tax=Halobaculum halobium TaxID=3032281 RepID=UPI0036F1BC20